MAYTITPYFLLKDERSLFSGILSKDFHSFLDQFPELKEMFQTEELRHFFYSTGFLDNPLYFSIVLSYNVYINEEEISELPDNDDVPGTSSDSNNLSAPFCKLFMNLDQSGKIILNDQVAALLQNKHPSFDVMELRSHRMQQLNYIFAKADYYLSWFHHNITYGADQIINLNNEEPVLDNMSIIGFGAMKYVYETYYSGNSRTSERASTIVKKFIDFSNYRNITYTSDKSEYLYVDNINPKSWIIPNLNTVFSNIRIDNQTNQTTDSLRRLKLITVSYNNPDHYQTTYKYYQNHQLKVSANDINVRFPITFYNNFKRWVKTYYYIKGGRVESFIGRSYVEQSSGGGSGGKGRADNVEENEYYWQGSVYLGFVLGLKLDRHISKNPRNRLDKRFWITNTPYDKENPKDKETPHVTTPTKNHSELMDWNFSLIYWKCQAKIDGQNKFKPRKNKPQIYSKPIFYRDTTKRYKQYKGSDLIRKKRKGEARDDSTVNDEKESSSGIPLNHKPAGDRLSAGSVMSKFLMKRKFIGLDREFKDDYKKWCQDDAKLDFVSSNLSATRFTNFLLHRDGNKLAKLINPEAEEKDQYQEPIIVDDNNEIKTDQEWCHLYGHGDGGSEEGSNFVSGSEHCNTEQLAIETGQRKRGVLGLEARITTYLMPAQGVEINEDERSNFTIPASVDFDNSEKTEFFPLARAMRYKLYYKVGFGNSFIKIFDHIYDAQSESFDYNEFRILEDFVDRKICVYAQGMSDIYRASIIVRFIKRFMKFVPDYVCSQDLITFIKDYSLAKKSVFSGNDFSTKYSNGNKMVSFIFSKDNFLLEIPEPFHTAFEKLFKES